MNPPHSVGPPHVPPQTQFFSRRDDENVGCLPPLISHKSDPPPHHSDALRHPDNSRRQFAAHHPDNCDDPVTRRQGGKARIPVQQREERVCARQNGNPFQELQDTRKHDADRGRQVVPRVIDTERIYPTSAVVESNMRAQAFERGPYTILPHREERYVPGRRPSQFISQDQVSVHHGNASSALEKKPSVRLRNNSDEDKLRKLLPAGPSTDDIRRNYANAVSMQSDRSYLERMVQNQFPVPRGPVVDSVFPPIHSRPSPRKYETHLPGFGLTIAPPSSSASLSAMGARPTHHAVPPPEVISSRRVAKQPPSLPQQFSPRTDEVDYRSGEGVRLIPRGFRESGRNIVTGDGG
jgi:hypothetical protein